MNNIEHTDTIKVAKAQNVFLVGPMGAGKTTIGRILARELNRDFYDSDHEVEARCGADITWIFDIEGEAGFRRREHRVIDDLTQLQGIVLSTGGGVILDPKNRTLLAARGMVLFLEVSIEQQLKRTQRDDKRPSLQGAEDRESLLREMYAKRDALYREVADIVISTDHQSPRSVAKKILRILR